MISDTKRVALKQMLNRNVWRIKIVIVTDKNWNNKL